MREVAGIVVGLVVSVIVAVIVGIVAVAATFTLPPGTDATDPNEVIQVLMTMSPATQLALAAAWLAGALAGAAVAKLISRRIWVAWVVALLVAVYFGLNALTLALPLWMNAVWVFAPLLGGLLANRLVGAGPAVVINEAEAPPANP
jgi:hypothetical protein